MAETSFTIFSDANSPGWDDGFADLLREGSLVDVDIVDSLDAAVDGESDVLVLNLAPRGDEKMPAAYAAALKARRILAMAPGANWLCDQIEELEVYGGMVDQDPQMVVVESGLLGPPPLQATIKPFAKPQEAVADWTDQTPVVWSGGTGDHPDYRQAVDDILTTEDCEYAVVMRQANFVYAGVKSHPLEWSEDYRDLIRRVALSLAQRPIEDLVPIMVELQTHPPGTVRFDLVPNAETETASCRVFHFRFDRPTAFTATLEHTGSNAMSMMFSGGKGRGLHTTWADTETGETLTVTANIGEDAIGAIGYRYWTLEIDNFDEENPSSATLTVRYDTGNAKTPVVALPGNASWEYTNRAAWNHYVSAQPTGASRHAVEAGGGYGGLDAARLATAREHGFVKWKDLEAHLAWTPAFDMEGSAVGVDEFFAIAMERYGGSFRMEQLVEFADDFDDGLRETLSGAYAKAESAGHGGFGGEHLLLALLDDAVSAHALSASGGDVARLRTDLNAMVDKVDGKSVTNCQISKDVCGAVYRADAISALGRDGINAANLLAGVLGEACEASEALHRQGVRQRDVVNYVSHGVPSVPVSRQERGASILGVDVEQASHAAFAKARRDGSAYLTLEHLLLAVLSEAPLDGTLRSLGVNVRGMRRELAGFIDATTTTGNADVSPGPTRAFHRVMQMAVAKSQSLGQSQATVWEVLWGLGTERDVPAADFLVRYNIEPADVAARMDER